VGNDWRPLFGCYAELGFSFEWRDFDVATTLDWARSFHPEGIEACLKLGGVGFSFYGASKQANFYQFSRRVSSVSSRFREGA